MSVAEKLTQIADNQQRVYNAGLSAGGVYYDRFWDNYQNYGDRRNYEFAFSGAGWNDESYNPKYPIIATETAFRMFDDTNVTDTKVDINIGTTTGCLFENATKLVTIRKLILANGSPNGNSWFSYCYALKNITFEGTIGASISFKECSKLTNESIQSIIEHLKDLTGLTTQNLILHATVGAKLTDAQKATITAKNWTLVY
jgi:hypothetical protein